MEHAGVVYVHLYCMQTHLGLHRLHVSLNGCPAVLGAVHDRD